MSTYTKMILVGTIIGIMTRMYMLRTDYRQYPTYPHGRIIHIALGVIASLLGSVAVPALFQQNYTAVTFLALAAQQFRDVRNMERTSLASVDENELVPRGGTYIEGIAMAFEGRNYLVIFTSFLTSLATHYMNWYGGALVGVVAFLIVRPYMSGKSVKDIAEVKPGTIHFNGPLLCVDDIVIMNVGSEDSRKHIMEHGLGVVIVPNNLNGKTTFAHLGQRQAILHDASIIMGVYRDSGTPSFIPLSKRDLNSGRVAVFLIPMEKDMEMALQVVKRSPVLENSFRKPLASGTLQQRR